ncbi:uncharacterized protein LOC110984989 [Acanthaster planci]|uniref:Uncharacterized protein LOC110984989 n=1 Tax=Acanthaster planci TaxID=133434 RepID=A0A8B7Z971_ACAPL|nr:uncharacterized protein LOC110984989 [Acanthaster planci]
MALLTALTVVGLVLTVSAVDVPVTTRYLTTEVTTLAQNSTITLIGYLCGEGKGEMVNITVVLNNNPKWILDIGVLYYYAVDSPQKGKADALCTNMNQGAPWPYCTVKSWPSAGDLYIKGRTGPVAAVSFSLDAERLRMGVSASVGLKKPTATQWLPPADRLPHVLPGLKLKEDKTVNLTEVITLMASEAVPRLQEAHLNFTFCPNQFTGSQYTITATVMGTDGESSWAQYLCDKYPCELSHPTNIVAFNGRQLPSNTVITAGGQWTQMYALVVCWGGPYDNKTGLYTGHFQFNAVANRQ